MNRCSFKGCETEPLNPGVTACEKHICPRCRIRTVVDKKERDMKLRLMRALTEEYAREVICADCEYQERHYAANHR